MVTTRSGTYPPSTPPKKPPKEKKKRWAGSYKAPKGKRSGVYRNPHVPGSTPGLRKGGKRPSPNFSSAYYNSDGEFVPSKEW